jgi:uncharacterized membrane protein
MSSNSSSDTLQVAIIVFVVFLTLQNVSIPPHFVVVCLLLLLNIVVLFISVTSTAPKLQLFGMEYLSRS